LAPQTPNRERGTWPAHAKRFGEVRRSPGGGGNMKVTLVS